MSLVTFSIEAREETWPLKNVFRISRGERRETQVVAVMISDGQHTGRGEGVPIRRYNQTTASVLAQIESIRAEKDFNRQKLQTLLPAGAARNALDCALWDLEAKKSGKRVWELVGLSMKSEVETSFTISLDSPDKMGSAAQAHSGGPILKLKLNGDDVDLVRLEAVRAAAPNARLIMEANESWSAGHYRKIVSALKTLRVELIEQPFPADADEVLETLEHPISVCADESCHTSENLPRLRKRYDIINVKLDKTGGLTEAFAMADAAKGQGFDIMVGCMVATSLAMAPAMLLTPLARFVDLDGPLLLARDRDGGLRYDESLVYPPEASLWG